jgi:hypothetical protein
MEEVKEHVHFDELLRILLAGLGAIKSFSVL